MLCINIMTKIKGLSCDIKQLHYFFSNPRVKCLSSCIITEKHYSYIHLSIQSLHKLGQTKENLVTAKLMFFQSFLKATFFLQETNCQLPDKH